MNLQNKLNKQISIQDLIINHVPVLFKYYNNDMHKYHCDILNNILFECIDQSHQQYIYEQSHSLKRTYEDMIFYDHLHKKKNLKAIIYHTINALMGQKNTYTTIIQTCSDFDKLCELSFINEHIKPLDSFKIKQKSVKKNERKQRLKKITHIVKLSNDSTFIEPNINTLVPNLQIYSDDTNNQYHNKKLYDIMFFCANYHKKNSDPWLKEIFQSNITQSIGELEHLIGYHIITMMRFKELMTTIIQTCHDFETVCNKWLSGDFPILTENLESHTVHPCDIILSNGTKYIEPIIHKHVPILSKYKTNEYHYTNLYIIMFACANHKINDFYFKQIITGYVKLMHSLTNGGQNTSLKKCKNDHEEKVQIKPIIVRNIKNHINELLKYTEYEQTIAQTCVDFENICNDYLLNDKNNNNLSITD